MRLDLSWKLDRANINDWHIWQNNADSLRTDQDITRRAVNASVVRDRPAAIENSASFINQQEEDQTRQGNRS